MKTRENLAFRIIILASLSWNVVVGHVAMTFPPGRMLDLDFLDNVRTKPPCGMPKGKLRTSIKAGSMINVTWHVAYPHRGGFRLELLDKNEKFLDKLSDPASSSTHVTGDPTAGWYTVKIPDTPCEDCTIRLVREANEWADYYYWSCSDISIVKASDYKEDCLGRGKINSDSSCTCNKGYWGPRCQYKDECVTDSDCGNGKCIDIGGTALPRKQCFCGVGYHGQGCQLRNRDTLPTPENLELSGHNKTVLSDRMQLFHKIVDASKPEADKEIEFVLVANATSFVAVGWRPADIDKGCKSMPAVESAMMRRKRAARGRPMKSNPTLLEPLMPERMKAVQESSMNSKRSPKPPVTQPPKLAVEPEPQAENSDIKAEPEPESEKDCSNKAEPEPEQTNAEPQPEGSSKAEPEPISEAEAESKPEPETEPSAEPESEPEPQASNEPEPEAPSKSEPKNSKLTEPSAEPNPEAEAKPESEPEPTNEPSGEPEAEAEPEKSSDSGSPEPEKSLAEPEAAADESAAISVLAEPGSDFKPSMEVSPFKLERRTTPYTPKGDFHPMECSDIIVGTARGMHARIRDYYTRDRSTPRLDTFFGGTEDITSATGWEKDGITTIIFRRKVKSSDPTDHTLSGSMQVIWSRGQEHGEYSHEPKSGLEKENPSIPNFYSQDELKYHGANKQRGIVFITFPKVGS